MPRGNRVRISRDSALGHCDRGGVSLPGIVGVGDTDLLDPGAGKRLAGQRHGSVFIGRIGRGDRDDRRLIDRQNVDIDIHLRATRQGNGQRVNRIAARVWRRVVRNAAVCKH